MQYYWDKDHKFAINAALKAQRPLLVRGEPGVGKSSLAKEAAIYLKRFYISETITARTEPNDLLWQFDGVKRLGEAQVLQHMDAGSSSEDAPQQEDKQKSSDFSVCLAKKNYISPGVLWWAYQPTEALKHYRKCPGVCCPQEKVMRKIESFGENEKQKGWVVLIDEIDKADSSVPNSLLEAFSENSFTVPYLQKAVSCDGNIDHPLVIITTNEDRQLPPAFLRRCFVLQMGIPEDDDEAVEWLLDRAGAYDYFESSRDKLRPLAEIVLEDRKESHGPHKPGLSEFLDFARVYTMSNEDNKAALKNIFSFVLKKNEF